MKEEGSGPGQCFWNGQDIPVNNGLSLVFPQRPLTFYSPGLVVKEFIPVALFLSIAQQEVCRLFLAGYSSALLFLTVKGHRTFQSMTLWC